jgi:hypothetical protein
MIYEQYFDGRKPSENQVIRAIKQGITKGYHVFEIAWGENMVTLDRQAGGRWAGWGWIKLLTKQSSKNLFDWVIKG